MTVMKNNKLIRRRRCPVTDKQQIREQGKLARREMKPEERAAASMEIARRIAASDVFADAGTVLIYKAMPDEVDLGFLTELPESEGKRFCYPRTLKEHRMEALLPSGPQDWKTGRFGIMEPDPETARHVSQDELDLVLCPCTAFDENGGRMGMGGGYYDRYLPGCGHAVVAAVAFEAQKTVSVPTDEHDIRMERVFTEKAVYCSMQET